MQMAQQPIWMMPPWFWWAQPVAPGNPQFAQASTVPVQETSQLAAVPAETMSTHEEAAAPVAPQAVVAEPVAAMPVVAIPVVEPVPQPKMAAAESPVIKAPEPAPVVVNSKVNVAANEIVPTQPQKPAPPSSADMPVANAATTAKSADPCAKGFKRVHSKVKRPKGVIMGKRKPASDPCI